jgi:glyoxylase-like metal-dependent hydrolase (beta-lactamase superfamily II)
MRQPFLVAALMALGLGAVAAAQQTGAQPVLRVSLVQGNVHLISGAGANVTVQVGSNGVLLVDTPAPAQAEKLMAEVRKLSPAALRYIVQTSVNADSVAGTSAVLGPGGDRALPFGFVGLNRASVIAHENVLNRLSAATGNAPATPPASLPTTTYFQPTMDFYNSEPIVLYHQPAAHTDSDTVVLFRKSDVISTGAIYTPGRFPVIDIARGGGVQGLIAALGTVLHLAVPAAFEDGGTQIVPGRGRISEETDVAEFRDMVVIVKDRVQDLIKKGSSLDQIKAAKPSRDYDGEYGATAADADRFVESIYRSLTQKPGGRP